MSQAWRVARIHSFELVPVSPTVGLLRVGAVTDTHAAPGDRRPTLLADDGLTVTRFAALPAPDDTGGALRSAYSAPREIVSPQTVFSLEFDDGLVIALSTPTPLTAAGAPDATAGESPDPAPEDWWGLFASLLLEAAHARAELQATHELRGLGDPEFQGDHVVEESQPAEDPHAEYMAADAEARIAEAVARAESEHEASGTRLAEMEVWSGELERRLTETTTELGEARQAAERDAADLQRLHGELAGARAELELFQTPGISPASELPVRPLPGPPRASAAFSPSDVDAIRREAVREAHRRADRDLADAGH